jgi:hypothetical protein
MPLDGLCPLSPAEKATVTNWLRPKWTRSSAPAYTHLQLIEDASKREAAKPIIERYLREAHDDALRFFSGSYVRTLDPRARDITSRAASSYPALVEDLTLAAFFGEVMAGLISELYEPHNLRWAIPVFCFRTHSNLFLELIRAAEDNRAVGRVFGRTGDDCLAFALNAERSSLSAVLLCEAKCSYTHRQRSIQDGHRNLSQRSILQLEFGQVIQILRDRSNPGDRDWVEAIETLRDTPSSTPSPKYDLLAYIFGTPSSAGTPRISPTTKHRAHTSATQLVAVESHLADIAPFIRTVYAGAFVNAAS